MCRSIRTLRGQEPPATREEVEAAALQFVRKVSGYRQPSRANREVFEEAVAAVADSTEAMLNGLVIGSPARGAS